MKKLINNRKKNLENILSKIKLNNKIFKNRIISSPISINMAENGYVTKNIIKFFQIYLNQEYQW